MAQGHELQSARDQEGPRPTPVAQPDVPEPEAVKRLRQLFAAGQPPPSTVLAILDEHRADREAILAFLHANAGNAYVAEVLAQAERLRFSLDRRELVAGDPSDPQDGYFIASQADKGARWRTEGGGFTGTATGKGLDARLRTGDDTALHLGVDAKDRSGVLGLEHDGHNVGELAGGYKGADDWSAGARRPFDIGGDAVLTPGLRHQVRPELGGADVAALGYRDPSTTAEGYLGRHESGGVAGGVTGSHQFDARTSASGYLDYSPDVTRFGLSGSHRLTDETTVSGALSHTERRHGDDITALSMSQRYRGDRLVGGLDLSYQTGGERDILRGSASADAELRPNLFAGVFGAAETGAADRPTGSVGLSVTFTPQEKTALTLAGIVDERGNLETRLELDLFRKRIENVGMLADNKKKALLSLFVSYSQGSRLGMLEDRYGAGQLGTDMPAGDGTVSAGIRIRF